MASDEVRKKWGTIFMGEREASVEQLNAMQEPMIREKQQKEHAQDYMERVRAKAADRAREILGAAYTERQKVLEEAKAEIADQRKAAAAECAKLEAEGKAARQMAQNELARAESIREEAEKIRENAHEEGFQKGMDEAGRELQEFRGELGQAVGAVLRSIERQRKNILDTWRQELVDLTQCAVQAGVGFILKEEREAILQALVNQALDMLENRAVVTARVNPEDEAAVSDMFRAARERVPELRQWIVTGDPGIEKGGLIADSGSGSVDLRRENFRGMVDGILSHLALPDRGDSQAACEVQAIVEREVAHIAALTPEPDQPDLPPPVEEEPLPEEQEAVAEAPETEQPGEPEQAEEMTTGDEPAHEPVDFFPDQETEPAGESPNYDALEEELFPLEEGGAAAPARQKPQPQTDPNILAEGGFL